MYKATQLGKIVFRLGETIAFRQIKNREYSTFNSVRAAHKNKTISIHRSVYCTRVASAPNAISGLHEDVDVAGLTNGDPELEKKLRVIVLEADVMRQEGLRVPDVSSLGDRHWRELLGKATRSQRKKHLEFLWKNERKREGVKARKELARAEREARPEYEGDGHIRYGLNHNTFLIRIYDTTINRLYNHNLVTAMTFGQKLVVDCGYDEHMVSRESANCARQLSYMFAENRAAAEPFDLHLCNVAPDGETMRALGRHVATLHEDWFPLHLHTRSYLELFPRERLVYLTPHCREELGAYDHDAVYIVGGIVDKVNHEPLSLARARRDGVRTARLPLDRHLRWGGGSGKSLTLNQMAAILLEAKETAGGGDWSRALRHVPRRKVARDDDGGGETDRRGRRPTGGGDFVGRLLRRRDY